VGWGRILLEGSLPISEYPLACRFRDPFENELLVESLVDFDPQIGDGQRKSALFDTAPQTMKLLRD
jgi:hypothetical protein